MLVSRVTDIRFNNFFFNTLFGCNFFILSVGSMHSGRNRHVALEETLS